MDEWTPGSLSIVVPVFNESGNLRLLVDEIAEVARPLGLPFEIVIVDDGSTDDTAAVLEHLAIATPELVVIALRRNFGQTVALSTGLDRARGEAIVTMDGDLQNDPRDIPRLLEKLSESDVVSGWRRRRNDSLLKRKLPSWIANWLIRVVTGAAIHDHGCGLKAYRAEVIRDLDLYADMHRLVVLMTMPRGSSIAEIEVNHRPRAWGSSHYGLWRVFQLVPDLVTIKLLLSFRDSPMRGFAILGLPFLVIGMASAALSLLPTTSLIVLASVSIVCLTTFGACLLYGLICEEVAEISDRRGVPRVLMREWRSR